MKFKAFFSTFLLSYIFWILFLAQDFNIFKLGYEELITGLVVAVVVGAFCSQFFIKKDGFWLFKKLRFVNLLIFIPIVNFFVALYLLFAIGTIGPNQYGPDPLAREHLLR